MQIQTKKNLLVVGALILPILLIIGVLIGSKIQSSLVSTEYDFVYAVCDPTSSGWYEDCRVYLDKTYTVQNQKIRIDESTVLVDRNRDGVPEHAAERPMIRVFQHDTKDNLSRELLRDEILALTIDPRLTSPDGVLVEGSSSGSSMNVLFFDVGSSYSYGYYLKKGSRKSPLNVTMGNSDYYYSSQNLKFIGWITK
jgi:hypothetical protein